MRFILLLILWATGGALCFAQPIILRRVILIGDAGEINPKQNKALNDAAAHILPGKSTVMFLGDNIYPHGMGLPGSLEEAETQTIIRSQFSPMRAAGAPTYFVPGNHDWDKSGKQGLAKIRRQGEFLKEQNDPGLSIVPANGCPGPVEIPLGDGLVIIAYDSEWWLFPHEKTGTGDGCDCGTKEEVLARMREIRDRNAGKFIVLASHHPFRSYGTHGGKYSLKDHIFPLTAVKKWLWIPLPVIGSLYPLLRSTIRNPEDMGHAWYRELIAKVTDVFKGSPGILYVAGHEHGLQLIKDNITQVVSGSGAKHSYARKGRHSLFADTKQGFVTVDLMSDKSLQIVCHALEKGKIQEMFRYRLAY
ncbi:metallophosphoesterase [Dyadobacter sp. CY261]|uniref:metallophosphoesterase n=1 Tax=Dyadobacter sp. CY261 TaxID=2907203 RepID=UPI001F408692|nr:metallophosphoesterase [Dyadobacter sp. CY261]MCF0069834.1 metallophosphoesterase [Dyadobacter sp. CY261]